MSLALRADPYTSCSREQNHSHLPCLRKGTVSRPLSSPASCEAFKGCGASEEECIRLSSGLEEGLSPASEPFVQAGLSRLIAAKKEKPEVRDGFGYGRPSSCCEAQSSGYWVFVSRAACIIEIAACYELLSVAKALTACPAQQEAIATT